MCSDRRLRSVALLALGLATLLAAACGKKGDPVPPPRAIPATTSDLAVRLRGDQLLFEMGYPQATVAGLPLADGLASVVLYRLELPAPLDGRPLTVAPEQLAAARPVLELAGPTLGGAVAGDRIRFETALPDPLPDPPVAHVYLVRTRAATGGVSAVSNTAILVPRAAPEGPAGLEAKPLKQGIALSWAADPGATAGYAVLRRLASESAWSAPLLVLDPGTTAWTDTAASYGQRWVYSVLSLASREPPIESAPRAEREVDYQDRFAPEPPGPLRALALPGEVRLVWEASPDGDVEAYRIERVATGAAADYETVATVPGGELEHVDTGLAAGASYSYRVRAEDAAGNVSEPGAAVEARLP